MHAYDKITNQLTNDERLQHDIETILQRLYVV